MTWQAVKTEESLQVTRRPCSPLPSRARLSEKGMRSAFLPGVCSSITFAQVFRASSARSCASSSGQAAARRCRSRYSAKCLQPFIPRRSRTRTGSRAAIASSAQRAASAAIAASGAGAAGALAYAADALRGGAAAATATAP